MWIEIVSDRYNIVFNLHICLYLYTSVFISISSIYKDFERLLFKLDLEKAEEPEIKLPTSVGSLKKWESSRKTSTFALLTMTKSLIVWITTNWKILKEMGIPGHLICLLRNLYAGQEATVRTGHGTTDCFQIGKGVCQGCILSYLCLFIFIFIFIFINMLI